MRLAHVALPSLLCIIHLRVAIVSGEFQGHVEDSRSSEDGMEVWGYSEVRKGAHMFWWLFYSTHPNGSDTRPLIIWLQGGPGLSSSGVGNLALMGPLDEHLMPRNDTWVKEANILFVDSPVGVGYSYIDNGALLAKNSDELSLDLVNMLDSVLDHLPQLKNMTVYIFGQSYGGKMAVTFAVHLCKAIENKEIAVNFQGVALGNAWISAVDTTVNYAPLMLHMSVIDQSTFDVMDRAAQDFAQEMKNCGPLCDSSKRKWTSVLSFLMDEWYSGGVNIYNLEKYYTAPYFESSLLPEQMNGAVHQKLHIIPDNVTWYVRNAQVANTLWGNDDLVPVVNEVDWLLERNFEVIVYQGQLDIMCNTNGALDWLKKLKWKKFPQFSEAGRHPLFPPGGRGPEMFVKAHENLKFYWVLKAGHAVPKDTPGAALRMLSDIINNQYMVAALCSESDRQHASFLLLIVVLILMTFHKFVSTVSCQ